MHVRGGLQIFTAKYTDFLKVDQFEHISSRILCPQTSKSLLASCFKRSRITAVYKEVGNFVTLGESTN